MRKNSVLSTLAGLLFVFFYTGCKKGFSDKDNCALIQQVSIIGANPSYYVGDSIILGTNKLAEIALYDWTHDDNPNYISEDNRVFIYPCSKSDEGWYHLDVSYPECAQHYDSVYISVINKPATAPCNPAVNAVSFSSIPNVSFPSVTWGMDPDWNCKNLSGYYAIGYPDFNIYFDFYWNTREPEDGEYSISNTITFDDNNPYSIFIASTYSSIYFEASPGKVYVSHVNGKIQVTFCGISLIGDLGGPSYTTTATGKLAAP